MTEADAKWNVGKWTDGIVLAGYDKDADSKVRCVDCAHFTTRRPRSPKHLSIGRHAGTCLAERRGVALGESRRPRTCKHFTLAPVGTDADGSERKDHTDE